MIIYTNVYCAIMGSWGQGQCWVYVYSSFQWWGIDYSANKYIYIYQRQKDSGKGGQGVKTFTLTMFSKLITWYKIQCQIYSKTGGASTSIIEYLSSQGRAGLVAWVLDPNFITNWLSDLGQDQVGLPKSHSLIYIMWKSPATTPQGWCCENQLRLCMYRP